MPNGQFGTDIGTALRRQVGGLTRYFEPILAERRELEREKLVEQRGLERDIALAGEKARLGQEAIRERFKQLPGLLRGMEEALTAPTRTTDPGIVPQGKAGIAKPESEELIAQETVVKGITPFIRQPSVAIDASGMPTLRLNTIPNPIFNTATTLRREFNQAQVKKNFEIIERSESAMREAYEMSIDPNIKSRIASDQALGVLFQKMLDPSSVVRESEYARTPEGASVRNQVRAFIPKLQKGGLGLMNEDRKALYEIAQKLLFEAKRTMNNHIDRYAFLSQRYSIPPDMVLGTITKLDLGEEPIIETEERSFNIGPYKVTIEGE